MTPSLYDLLNVDESASTDEIRGAWKAAIADLDPSDRRFRAFNQAAETLLDPERRRAYDAELAAAQPVEEEPEPEAPTEPEPEPEPEREPEPEAADDGEPSRRPVPMWLLVVACVCAVAAIVGASWLSLRVEERVDHRETIDAREEGARQAESAAEAAIGPVLSFDYRGGLEDDATTAEPYLTEEYGSERRSLMADLETQARQGQVVVEADAIATGITRSGDDRAEILVFVDQRTSRKDTPEPFVLRQWVRVTMVHEDGHWLIDNLAIEADDAG